MSLVLVGEIGINHNGDVNIAKNLINVSKLAGLDFVKFQKRDVYSVYSKEFLDSPRESPWGKTQREQKLGLEFNEDEYKEINNYCLSSNIKWFASPWDSNSVKFLNKFDCPYIKIASACITNYSILEAVKQTNKSVIISTGMSTKLEVDNCVSYLGDQIEYILACNSSYPTKDKNMNLNFIKTLKEEYSKYKIGLSNHNSGIQFCLASIALGVEMIEFHITLDRSMYGSDQSASIETTGILLIGKHSRTLKSGIGDGKWTITQEELLIKEKLRK